MKNYLRWSHIDNGDRLEFKSIPESAFAYNRSLLKRALDLILTIPGTIVISPLLLIVALLIRLDSKGAVIFRQKRVGLDGRLFDMYKFRSMYENTNDAIHMAQIQAYAEGKLDEAAGVKIKDDPRVTKIRKFIRTPRKDELPQIINVLKGEMSLVGPRPVPVYEAEKYKLWHSERLRVLPGMTGLWQVSGRSFVSFDEQLRLDIRYIRHQSFWLDIKIIIYTLPAVLSKRGAG